MNSELINSEKEALRQLDIYKSYLDVESELIKIKADPSQRKQAKALEKRLQEISDSIRFKNPLVWLMFKEKRGPLANKPEEIIRNVGDFKNHLKHEKSICDQRVRFFNRELNKIGIDLFDEKRFPNSMPLNELYSQEKILAVATDKRLLTEWESHEFYEEDGKPAKWKNYL